jgi:N-acetylmuramoyl-L-alanine amidase
MKKKRIVIHCSAGSQSQSAKEIIAYHLRPISRGGRGWKTPGYHYIIEKDGNIVQAVDEERIANGVKGYNRDSIHICYIGGVDNNAQSIDNRTECQKEAMHRLVNDILRRRPGLDVCGHRDLSPDRNGDGKIDKSEWIKACPSFDVRSEHWGEEND